MKPEIRGFALGHYCRRGRHGGVAGFSLTRGIRSVLWVIYSQCVTPHILSYKVVLVSAIPGVMNSERQLECGVIAALLIALCIVLFR